MHPAYHAVLVPLSLLIYIYIYISQMDLFPRRGSLEKTSLETRSVRSSILEEIAELSEPGSSHDRLFYTDQYNRVSGTQPEPREGLSDFEKYNNEVLRETLLRDRLKKKKTGDQGTLLPIVELDGFDDILPPPPVEKKSWIDRISRLGRHSPSLKRDLHAINSWDTQIIDTIQPTAYIDEQIKLTHIIKEQEVPSLDDEEPLSPRHEVQRKLSPRHMHQIALGGTLGVGLFLSSGKAFSMAGPLGALLGFIIAGAIVLASMLSYCEMVTLIPMAGGVVGISSRFVEDAFGFALGLGYWLSYLIGFPTEITASAIMLSYYPNLSVPGPYTAGWVSLFLVVVTAINLCDIRVYGEVEYFSSFIKVLFLLGMIVFNIVLNRGGVGPYHNFIGFKFWNTSLSQPEHGLTYGPFRPTFDLTDTGVGSLTGIGGSSGRFLQVLVATLVAAYAYIGVEIVLIAGGEAKNPRKSIPSAAKTIYWRILLFYIIAVFVVGLNFYSGDPRLIRYYTAESSHPSDESTAALQDQIISLNGGKNCQSSLLSWAGFSNGNQSPWAIALQSAGLCNFASILNGFLVYFALTAGSSQLYASSRTLYYMSIQGKAPQIFSRCSKNGVPYVSVIFSSLFGSLAYLSVNNNTALVFERFINICATSGLLVWSGMCLSFIRFYYALQLRPDIISRDDETYPYRSPFQPYLAYFGFITGLLLVLIVGFVVFLKGSWSVVFFFTSYGSLILLTLCYIAYKVIRRTKIHRVDQMDLDSGRREIDRIVWEEDKFLPHTVQRFLANAVRYFL